MLRLYGYYDFNEIGGAIPLLSKKKNVLFGQKHVHAKSITAIA
jgi:hypothetical protein